MLYARTSLKSCFCSCHWIMRIMSWRGWLAVAIGLNFFAPGHALCVYLWTPRFYCDPEHPALKGCSLQAALQLGSAGLLSPVFTSNPEPLQPLQLDPGHGRDSGMAHATSPPQPPRRARALAARLLPTKKGFLSCLAGRLETHAAKTQITRLAEQAACSFEGKLWNEP